MAQAGGSGGGAGRAGRRGAAEVSPPAPAGGVFVSLGGMLSARTISRLLGRERKWVLEQCRRGTWPGTKMVGNAWRVPASSFYRWMNG